MRKAVLFRGHANRFLAALTVALLPALVAIAVLGGMAFGAIVGLRFQAESMTRSSADIIERDETTDDGSHIRFTATADAADSASQVVPASSSQVNQIQIRSRQLGGGVDKLAVYVDGTAVGVIQPNAGSTWTTQIVNLATPMSAGVDHTISIGPNQPNNNFVALDWFELHNTGTTPPPTDTDGDGVPDDTDQCDTQPGPASNNGCPVPQPSGFNPGYGKGSPSECTITISSGSIENAAKALGNGQVLCVRGGVYTEGDKRLNLDVSGTSSAPKKIKAYPGERVELRGAIIGKGSHWIIEGLFVDASYSPVMTTPGKDGPRTNTDQAIKWTGGTNLRFDSVELINRRSDLNPDLAGSCLLFGGTKPTNITIENSSIHQCGQLPRTNHEHCLYLGQSSGLTVRNNWVYDCADRSIKLDPDTDNALVVGNLVDSDHQAGITLDQSANNDTVRNNVVDTPNGKTIFTGSNYAGSGNAVIDNCVWDTDVALAGTVTESGNVLADPLISGHTVTNPTCAAKLPADSPFRP